MHRLTYLNDNLKNGKLIRWPEQCFPLNVYIAPCAWYSMTDADKYGYMNMVKEALRLWESVGQGKFSFNIVNALNDSQMNVEWRRVDRKSLGNCSFNFDSESRLYSAEVSIGISDGIIHKQYMDENEVFHTIIHEIGHALGLGHSTNPEDIMCDKSWTKKVVKHYIDQRNLSNFAERGDYTFISGNVTWIDQMIQYASRRKSKIGSFKSFKLDV